MSSSSGSLRSMIPAHLTSTNTRVLELSPLQWDALEAHFARVKNPHPTDLILLAAEIGLDQSEVEAWYMQRIAAWRKQQGLNPVSGRVD